MVLQEACYCILLVVRYRKDVTESSSGEDDLLASALRLEHRRVGVDLGSTNGGDEGATRREGWVEDNTIC